MVVNRRISVSAAPPVSRTASMQPAVRVPMPSTPSIPDVLNRTDGPKRERRHTKVIKKRIVPYPGLLQVLLLVLSISVYAAVVCRSDSAQTLLLCRSLDQYRTQIVDVYVLRPFESVIHHAEPYVSPLKPYAASTTSFARTRIIPHISAFIDSSLSYDYAKIAPRLHWLIVDRLWKGVIKSLYFDFLHPTLERHIHPFYNNYLAPGACKGVDYAQASYVRVLPHAQHYLSNAQKNAAQIHEAVRLYVLNLYDCIRSHVVVFSDQVRTHAVALAQKAGHLYNQFIDPHVQKILDRVAEKYIPSSSTDSSAHPLVGHSSDIPPLDTATV